MHGQILRTTDAAPTIDLEFYSSATATAGKAVTTLTQLTAGLTISYLRGNVMTAIALVAQTPTGAYVAGGFCHRANGLYRLDPPVALNAAGVTDVTVAATLLPADVEMNALVVALTPDDLTAAAVTDASLSIAVRTEMLSVRWGQQTQPVGGSTQVLTVTDMPSGTALGVVRRYLTSTGETVGQTEMTAS